MVVQSGECLGLDPRVRVDVAVVTAVVVVVAVAVVVVGVLKTSEKVPIYIIVIIFDL